MEEGPWLGFSASEYHHLICQAAWSALRARRSFHWFKASMARKRKKKYSLKMQMPQSGIFSTIISP